MLGKIKKHELRDIWRNEAIDFTKWMEANLDTLSQALGWELSFEEREHSVGPFFVDILATDEQGERVVIENQLEKTDHGHLGQIITYCSNLEAKTCIWIAKEPRQEHINAVNWLNKETSLNLYLLKVEAISIDGSKPAALFQVICRPDEDIRLAAAAEGELTPRGHFNIDFWTQMNRKCESVLPGFCTRKPLKTYYHSQASGRSGFRFSFIATSKFYGVNLYIDTNNADLNEIALNQLKDDSVQIEKEFGHPLSYELLPAKRACRIQYIIGTGDVMKLDLEKVQGDLIEHMVRMERTFKRRIQNLSLDIDEAA